MEWIRFYILFSEKSLLSGLGDIDKKFINILIDRTLDEQINKCLRLFYIINYYYSLLDIFHIIHSYKFKEEFFKDKKIPKITLKSYYNIKWYGINIAKINEKWVKNG